MTDHKLKPVPLRQPPPELPPFQAAHSNDRPDRYVIPSTERFVRAHLARHYLAALRAREPARFAILIGAPGTTKSSDIKTAVSRAGADLVETCGGTFAGSTEGGAAAVLDATLADIERVRATRQQPIALLIDDAELSAFADRKHTEYAVSRDVLLSRLQKFADTVCDGAPLPVFITLNECAFRPSLFRPGRAVWAVHSPTLEDKAHQLVALYGATTEADGRLIADLLARHSDKHVAFFAAARTAAVDAVITDVIDELGVTGRLAAEEVESRIAALTVADFVRAADAQTVAIASSYLSATTPQGA